MKPDRQMAAKLDRLMLVADLRYRRDMASFATASSKVHDIQQQISKLRAQMDAPLVATVEPQALLVTAKHRVWIERCLRALNLELAKAMATSDAARAVLTQSSGRKEALGIVRERAVKNPVE